MNTVSLADLVPAIFDACRRSVRVAGIAKVVSYDPAEQTATIMHLVCEERRGEDEERVEVEAIEIPGCPVVWPGGGLRGLTMGLREGDEVLALVRTQSHDEIDANTESGPILSAGIRRLDLADAIVLPGYVRPGVGAPASTFREDGAPVLYFESGEALRLGSSTADKALALAEKVDARLSSIASDFNSHTHVSAPSGSPTSPPPTSVPPTTMGPFAPVTCDDVKVRS